MRHVQKALIKLKEQNPDKIYDEFIQIENCQDEPGVAPIVKFTIQSDPISEVGINGVQALDMLEYTKCLFESLNDVFPCEENKETINKIQEAIFYQHQRTKDRIQRGVEGKNES